MGRDERRSTCDAGRSCTSRIVQEFFIQTIFLTNSSFHPEYLFENFFSSPRIALFTLKKTRHAVSLNGTWRKFSALLHSMATSSSARQVLFPILLQYFSLALISGGLEETARRGWDSGVPRSEGEAFSLSKQMEEVVHCEVAPFQVFHIIRFCLKKNRPHITDTASRCQCTSQGRPLKVSSRCCLGSTSASTELQLFGCNLISLAPHMYKCT